MLKMGGGIYRYPLSSARDIKCHNCNFQRPEDNFLVFHDQGRFSNEFGALIIYKDIYHVVQDGPRLPRLPNFFHSQACGLVHLVGNTYD